MVTTTTKATITLNVDSDVADFYATASAHDRRKIDTLFQLSLLRFRTATPQQLTELLTVRADAEMDALTEEELNKFVQEEIRAYRAGR